MVVGLFFVLGAFAQAPAAAKPLPPGAEKAVNVKVTPANAKRKLPPLMEKLPPLPPRPPRKVLPPGLVVVRVNGIDITMGMINRQVDLMAVLLKNKSKRITPQKLRQFKRENLKRFSNDLFFRTIIDTSLTPSNIVVSEAMKASVVTNFVKRYGARGDTVESLKAVVAKAGYRKELEAQLAFEAKFKTFLTTTCSNRYFVTEAQVQEVKKSVQAYNARSNATNEFNFATAKKMAERAKQAGEDFAKLADQYSQDPEKRPGGKLGECDESDFADELHVWRAVSKLKVGEVSEALELENGYAVFKVLAIKSPEESETGAIAYELARIFYRKAFVFPDQTEAEFRADVESEAREKLSKELLVAFRKQSKVERPNGDVEVQ